MIGRSEIIIKWGLYAAAGLLCCVAQGLVLQHLRLFGVIPFLYPAVAAIVAMYEGSLGGTAYALGLGFVLDLTLPGPIPCFYTLIFPLVGLLSGLITRSWLPAGFFCAVAVSVTAFLLTDLFHGVVLLLSGHSAWSAVGRMCLRETLATIPMIPFLFFLFHAIFQKTHQYD